MPITKTTLTTLELTEKIDCLLIIRSKDDEPWSEEKENQAITDHDGVGKFLRDCVKYKKEVYACLKGLM